MTRPDIGSGPRTGWKRVGATVCRAGPGTRAGSGVKARAGLEQGSHMVQELANDLRDK